MGVAAKGNACSLFLHYGLKPVECAVVSRQRNEGVRNTKPPAMRVVQ